MVFNPHLNQTPFVWHPISYVSTTRLKFQLRRTKTRCKFPFPFPYSCFRSYVPAPAFPSLSLQLEPSGSLLHGGRLLLQGLELHFPVVRTPQDPHNQVRPAIAWSLQRELHKMVEWKILWGRRQVWCDQQLVLGWGTAPESSGCSPTLCLFQNY